LLAAFRQENTFGSFISQVPNLPDSVIDNKNFDLWGELTEEERLNEQFLSNVSNADNITEVDAVRRQRAKEQRDRKIISEGSFLPTLMAAGFDPINLIPVGGVAYRTYKVGASILTSGLVTGAVAAGTTAATEAALHQTQLTRTYGESATNIAAAGFLGIILGATPRAINNLITKSEVDGPKLASDIDRVMDPEGAISRGENSVFGDGTVGAAQVNTDAKVRGAFARAATKALGFDPLSRTITSDAAATRQTVNRLAENPLDMDQPLRTSVESKIKIHDGKLFEGFEANEKAFLAYQKDGGNFKRRAFNEAVGKAIRNGSDNVHIQKSADDINAKVYEPLKKDAIEAKILPEDVDVTTAKGYLNRLWNKEKLTSNLSKFVEITSRWLNDENIKLVGKAKAERGELAEIKISQKVLKKSESELLTKSVKLSKLESEQTKILSQKQKLITRAFEKGEAFKGAQKGRKKGLKGERRELGVQEAKLTKQLNDIDRRVSGLKGEIEKLNVRIKKEAPIAKSVKFEELKKIAEKAKFKEGLDLEKQDFDEIASEIAGRIMGTPDGRLPYDYQIAENSSRGGKATALKGPFKSRSFNIPDELVEDFLENDVELLMGRYVKSVAPDIELVKEFGDVNLTNEIKNIEAEWRVKIEKASKAGNEKEARKLAKKRNADIRDISAMRDRMRGTFGQVDWDNPWVRAGRVARDLNYMRLLGGVVASSFPDIARVLAAEGIVRTFNDGLVPMIKNIKGFRASAREAKLYGVGTDALLGGRAELIADIADFTQGGTAFERGVRTAATKFSSVNLMNKWTGGIKQLHTVVQQSRLISELKAGIIDTRLNQLGISDADAVNIAGEMKKYSTKIDGVEIANSKKWDNQELASMWGAALRKESDRVIIVPGQERPLFMSTELGKTIFQFKTFMFSATQRVLISNLQLQDKHYMQGMLGLVGIGMLSYALKNWDAGRPLSDDPAVWVTEGIDRSGMLGMLMEVNNTIEKITTQHYGLRPLLGINVPSARYASRTALDSALGPTFGLAGEVVRIAGAATGEREWSDSDTRALRRLLPGQNLSLIRQALDKIEEEL